MSGLRIVELDVDDGAAFAAWYEAYAVAERHGGEEVAAVWQLEELRVAMQAPTTRSWFHGWSGVLGDRVVVAGWLRGSLVDNRDRAKLGVHVLPAHRRRGYGAAMLERLEEVARDRGRSVLVAEAAYAYDAGPAGSGEPGPEFARARGYELALGDVQRLLRLPVADALLDRLAGEAAPRHASYTLRSWVGPVPDELLQGWADLAALLLTEAPTGELEVEPETLSPAMVREREEVLVKQGRTKVCTVALTAAGELVAYSDLVLTDHEPDRAYQWGTLVRRDHRGHRLGVAVKVANLRRLQAERPGVGRLITYNAEVNVPMIAVNDLLGYEPVARLGEFQKRR